MREAAEETGLVLAADDLVVSPTGSRPSRPPAFSTWFFVVAVPPGLDDVVVDGGEIGDHVWTTPGDGLDRHAAGDIELRRRPGSR